MKMRALTLQKKRREDEDYDGYFFFMEALNSSMGIAGSVVSLRVPLEPSSNETFLTACASP